MEGPTRFERVRPYGDGVADHCVHPLRYGPTDLVVPIINILGDVCEQFY